MSIELLGSRQVNQQEVQQAADRADAAAARVESAVSSATQLAGLAGTVTTEAELAGKPAGRYRAGTQFVTWDGNAVTARTPALATAAQAENAALIATSEVAGLKKRTVPVVNLNREYGFAADGIADDTGPFEQFLADVSGSDAGSVVYQWEAGSIIRIKTRLRFEYVTNLTLIGFGVTVINENGDGSEKNNGAVLDFFRCINVRIEGGLTVSHPGIGDTPPLTGTDPRRTYGGAGFHFWQCRHVYLSGQALRVSNMGLVFNSCHDIEVDASARLCMGDGVHFSNDCTGIRGTVFVEDVGDDICALFGLTKYPGGGAWPAPTDEWPSAAGQAMPLAGHGVLNVIGNRGAARGLTLGGVQAIHINVAIANTRLAGINLTSGSPAAPDPADTRVGGDTRLCKIVGTLTDIGRLGQATTADAVAVLLDGVRDKVTNVQRYVEGIDLDVTVIGSQSYALFASYARGLRARLRVAGTVKGAAYLYRSPGCTVEVHSQECTGTCITVVESDDAEVGGRIENSGGAGVVVSRSARTGISARFAGNGRSLNLGYNHVELVDRAVATTLKGCIFDKGANANTPNYAVSADATSTGTTISGGALLNGGAGNPNSPFNLIGAGRIAGVGGYAPGHVAPPAAVTDALGTYVSNPYPYPVRVVILGGTLNDVGLRANGQAVGVGPARFLVLAPGEALALFADPAPSGWVWTGMQ